ASAPAVSSPRGPGGVAGGELGAATSTEGAMGGGGLATCAAIDARHASPAIAAAIASVTSTPSAIAAGRRDAGGADCGTGGSAVARPLGFRSAGSSVSASRLGYSPLTRRSPGTEKRPVV